jgi:hypothetical protein
VDFECAQHNADRNAVNASPTASEMHCLSCLNTP